MVGVPMFSLDPFHGSLQSPLRFIPHGIHNPDTLRHIGHEPTAGDYWSVCVEQIKNTTLVAEKLHGIFNGVPGIFRKIRGYENPSHLTKIFDAIKLALWPWGYYDNYQVLESVLKTIHNLH